MLAMSAALRALLAGGQYVSADCWTFALNGGFVARWTSGDIPALSFNANGNIFTKKPLKRGPISVKRGVEVATLNVDITADANDLLNGQPIIPFIRNHGLDGANVKLERAFAPDWGYMQLSGALETLPRFDGIVTSIDQIKGAIASFTVSSHMVKLNTSMPRNLWQVPCMHTVYDAGCTLNKASFSATGTVSGSAGATVSFGSSLTPVVNDYALGQIVFSSGANAGISRTIRSNDGAGNFALINPLPNGLANGDAFTVYAGCDLTQARCTAKFNNLPNFKATPFVPTPQTPLGSQSKTTTTKSGK